MQPDIYCHATINYRQGSGWLPFAAEILNARQKQDLAWQKQGFELIRHESAVQDWTCMQEIEACHYAEIESLARSISGCDEVLYFPALLRSPEAARQHPDYAPIALAHSDYAESYRDMLTERDHPYQARLAWSSRRAAVKRESLAAARRLLVLQFWRNTGATWPDWPLALCDSGSSSRLCGLRHTAACRQSLTPCLQMRSLPLRINGTPSLACSRRSFWCFAPMTVRQVDAARPFWTLHSAFQDPYYPRAPARESIEMRAVCIFTECA